MWDDQRREGSRRHSTDSAAVARSEACAVQGPSGGQWLSVNTMGKPRENTCAGSSEKIKSESQGWESKVMLRTTSLDGVKGRPSWTFSDFLSTVKGNLRFHSAGPPVGTYGVSVSVFSSASELLSSEWFSGSENLCSSEPMIFI